VSLMRLFVGNLPYSVSETDLQEWFIQAGIPVDNVSVVRDRVSGEARGFGFVEIEDGTVGQRAIEACNGKDLRGRALVVNEARPMERRQGNGFGGGRGAGSRGGGRRDFGGSRNRW